MNDDIAQCFAQNFLNDLKTYLRNDVEAYYRLDKLLEKKISFNGGETVYGFTDFSILLTTDNGPIVFSPDELDVLCTLLEKTGNKKAALADLFAAFTNVGDE